MRTYDWHFPLPRTHTGVLMGNGTLGAIVWGKNNVLTITLGRADLWDHRGGMSWTEEQSYVNIRKSLEQNDEKGLRKLFERGEHPEGTPGRPSIIPIGHCDLVFPQKMSLDTATLDIDTGVLRVRLHQGKTSHTVDLIMNPKRPLLHIRCSSKLTPPAVKPVPAWKTLKEQLSDISFSPAKRFKKGDVSGWVQDLPVDPGVCVGWRTSGRELTLAVARAADSESAPRPATVRLLDQASAFTAVCKRASSWWKRYWRTVPSIDVPKENIRFLYEYGMYKFATFTNPDGVAATLQGPWIEDYQMPPWSSDYHFNINVQMCYQPAYYGNRLENLKPLFDLIESWKPKLKHNAKVFLGIDDGYMLPHAVDDRCTCMGGFWTGSIDHGCTAWVASMMYRYYRFTMDREFLEKTAYPFMFGVMRVYEEMLEEHCGALRLPVSVSPEYRGAAMNAWGANASFQLSCIHMLAEQLVEAAGTLTKRPRPIWRKIQKNLPKACLVGEPGQEKIGLWEDTDLEESHRHHSHLAGITPFDSLDLDDPQWKEIVERTIAHWIYQGPSLWSGWCVPWASAIHTRLGNGTMAALLIDIWQKIFTNMGHGTLHDANAAGFSLFGVGATGHGRRNEIMQMDAGMGVICAITEMLLYERRGVHYVFRGVPREWAEASFGPMRTPGAFLVSGVRKDGATASVTIKSPKGGTFLLANPWEGSARIKKRGKTEQNRSGAILRIATRKNDLIHIRPV